MATPYTYLHMYAHYSNDELKHLFGLKEPISSGSNFNHDILHATNQVTLYTRYGFLAHTTPRL